ncbi:hypothetical protein AQJ27_51030 [Streptomyces olivochromogenes]|nr:hypothetical protein AQJ27_51030 [Streptomyces olivochromogenes]
MPAAITTTVITVVAGLSPQEAWKEPILRLADTIIGVAAGVAAAILLNEIGRGGRGGRSSQHDGPRADPPG